MKNHDIDEEKINCCAFILKALSHKVRLKILYFISYKKVVCVNKIYRTLHLTQSITSQQLRILRDAKLVTSQRQGQKIFYRVNYPFIMRIVKVIDKLNS
jgi:ArsR family transcriptional regulator, lead/cadmium/zinc/bismuth-responsive transcriptional repressor